MLKLTLTFLTLVVFLDRAYSWRGQFHRFSPEKLPNMGYGVVGNNRPGQSFLSSADLIESMLQSEEDEELPEASNKITCSGRRCSANEHCCSGTVCVDLDGPSLGTCLPHHKREGAYCQRNVDCDSGLICTMSEAGKTCQSPMNTKKQYNEDCTQSSECDIGKGLCCQLLRRHRQAPRKACSYFRDPLVCTGVVSSTDLVLNEQSQQDDRK